MHVVVIVVLYALIPEGGEGNCRGMQPGHVIKQPLGRVTPHVAKLDNHIKRLFCDYGSRLTDKIEQLFYHLKKCLGVVGKRDRKKQGRGFELKN